ncbi:conserved Plasmodium protein, unknown function [Plasmodium malariae]|uniref:Uncharacterized protein n=1 Tax=Plasmodium malariae TaxID=5858 RepID=A0A1A8X827_PLAMA|nr:conserved Plasmodium protein, unknown function [Plasmodium malariae]
MSAKNNMFHILRQEDKIKRKSKKLKEDQIKKENEKKNASNFSFDISKYSSWADMVDEYDEFFYEVDKLQNQDKNSAEGKNGNGKKKKGKKKKKKVQDSSEDDDENEDDEEDEEHRENEEKSNKMNNDRINANSSSKINSNNKSSKSNNNNKSINANSASKQKQAEKKKKKSKKEREKNTFESILLEFTKNDTPNFSDSVNNIHCVNDVDAEGKNIVAQVGAHCKENIYQNHLNSTGENNPHDVENQDKLKSC